MNYWTLDNTHKYTIEAFYPEQQELADWLAQNISDESPMIIQYMLDTIDSYAGEACKALGWLNTPPSGGLEVHVWEHEENNNAII